PLIGKIGLGDIEISDDNKRLYVINLFDKKLYTIDIATKTLVGAGVSVPNPCGASGEFVSRSVFMFSLERSPMDRIGKARTSG
nr:hypothetical protein [Pirellula sp.]